MPDKEAQTEKKMVKKRVVDRPANNNGRLPSRPLFDLTDPLALKEEKVHLPLHFPTSAVSFEETAEIGEYTGGAMPNWPIHRERSVSNPYRRYATMNALTETGGVVPYEKGFKTIKPGQTLPPPPVHSTEVEITKDSELPDSQTYMGTLKAEAGPAEVESVRLAKLMEEMSCTGGFYPKELPKKRKPAAEGKNGGESEKKKRKEGSKKGEEKEEGKEAATDAPTTSKKGEKKDKKRGGTTGVVGESSRKKGSK